MVEPHVERTADGGALWIHDCVDPEFNPSSVSLPIGEHWWLWVGDNTLMPSILCHRCNVHGFWTDGKWVPA